MLKYNKIIIHDTDHVDKAISNLKNDEILLGKIDGRNCILKYIDEEEWEGLKSQIDII